jgi:hypothetical protein
MPRAPSGSVLSAQRMSVFEGRGELRDKPQISRRQSAHHEGHPGAPGTAPPPTAQLQAKAHRMEGDPGGRAGERG